MTPHSRVACHFAQIGRWTPLHLLCIGLLSMGLFMCISASELGPFAALFVAQGIFMAIFALLLEVLIAIRVLLARLAASRIGREVEEP